MSQHHRLSGLLATFVIGACTPAPPATIEQAALTIPTRFAPASLYLTLRNVSAAPLTVLGVDVEGAGESTLQTTAAHRMSGAESDDPMVMLMPVDSITVAPGATQRFAPGGYVVVARRLAKAPADGDSVAFTIRFSNGTTVRSVARVLPYVALEAALDVPGTPSVADVPVVPTVASGREAYMSNGCASCHGRDGHGDGPIASSLTPPPRDFRTNTPYRNGNTVADIAQTLATGIPNGGQMPLFAHLTDAERRALALYVRSLRQPSSEDITP